MINFLNISFLLISLTCLGLGLLIIGFGREKIHRLWSLFNISLAIWAFGCFMGTMARDPDVSLFWWTLGQISGVWASAFFFHVVCILCTTTKKPILILGYANAIIFDLLAITQNMDLGVQYLFGSMYYLKALSYKILIVICVWSYIAIQGHYELFKYYGQLSDKKTKIQFKFWIFGMMIGYGGGALNFLPMFDIMIYPYTVITIAIYCVIATYAIFRHQMLNIEVIIKKSLVFAGLLAAVFAILILPTILIQEYILRTAGFAGRISGLAISGLIIILTMRRIETFLINVTDRFLFQKKYNYKELLNTFATEVLTVLELDKLISLTVSKLKDIIRLNSCEMLVFSDKKRPDEIIISASKSKGYLLKSENPNVRSELIIPITMQEEIVGSLLLGKKKSDEAYSQDDLDILLPLSRTLAIAISNAQLLKRLSEVQKEAVQKEKMATVGTLVAGMAHEIQNPITTINIFSEYLQEKIMDNEFREKYRSIVVKEIDKIDHIIQAMVDFSSEETGFEPEAVSIYDSINEIITLMGLRYEIGSRIQIVNEISPDISPIKANKKEFEEIILNLTQNGIHAIKDAGKITFKAFEAGDSVSVEIKDTGCGMSEEVLDKLFNPFFTTRSKGFGLGLFVVKELVKRNNGTISVESKVGEGTKFTLRFQRAKKNRKI